MSAYPSLTDAQVQSFLENGYFVVKQCVDPALIKRFWIAAGNAWATTRTTRPPGPKTSSG